MNMCDGAGARCKHTMQPSVDKSFHAGCFVLLGDSQYVALAAPLHSPVLCCISYSCTVHRTAVHACLYTCCLTSPSWLKQAATRYALGAPKGARTQRAFIIIITGWKPRASVLININQMLALQRQCASAQEWLCMHWPIQRPGHRELRDSLLPKHPVHAALGRRAQPPPLQPTRR